MTAAFNRAFFAMLCLVFIASCSAFGDREGSTDELFQSSAPDAVGARSGDGSSVLDFFRRGEGAGVKVNRFLWTASLQVLDFLPVESADPFTGVITTGFGRPPGGGRAYRATILISDPALDARSLNVALQSQSGSVSVETQRAVEDAILARARQLRVEAKAF